MSLVSVVIGFYGPIEKLRLTLASISDQTHKEVQVIIVDDGNAYDVEAKIADYSSHFASLIVVRNSQNKGLTYSLSIGCKLSEGEFIARIDAGDYMIPKSRLVDQLDEFLNNTDLALVFGRITIADLLNGDIYNSHPRLNDEVVMESFDERLKIPHVTVMMRKTAYESAGGYDLTRQTGQDTEFWPRLLKCKPAKFLPDSYAIAPMEESSISVRENNRQIVGKIRRIRASSVEEGLFRSYARIIVEVLKMAIPRKVRVKLRYQTNMTRVDKLREPYADSLSDLYRSLSESKASK